jgi:hypothetical protein
MFPPMLEMMKKYAATEVVLISVGTNSTSTASVTPTHISPEKLSDYKN